MKKIFLWLCGLLMASSVVLSGVSCSSNGNKNAQSQVEQTAPSDIFVPSDAQNVIGKWKLRSDMAPELNSTIVIFERNDSCFYKETYDKGTSKTVLLRKDGDKYFDTESDYGEYFLVKNGKLSMYDNDGLYGGGTGYVIVPLE